ncbi:MAG TPA: hypothetical protein VFL57_03855 [Bryobacteraceae bacterium]|nr:hypothetical protein [Bryobacteraceae bacterium]
MRSEIACSVVLLAVIAGCKRYPDSYAPPEQRQPLTFEEPPEFKSFIAMSDAAAPLHFVKDIRPALEGGAWRWTLKQPTVRLAAPKDHGLKFTAEVAVPGITFRDTGPVAITVAINGHTLETFTLARPGPHRLEKPIPAGWLRSGDDNTVTMEIDKLWTEADGDVQLGFILTSIGFTE